jgi:hypothetical protein
MDLLAQSYFIVLGGFALLYLIFFLSPFLRMALVPGPSVDLKRLNDALQAELDNHDDSASATASDDRTKQIRSREGTEHASQYAEEDPSEEMLSEAEPTLRDIEEGKRKRSLAAQYLYNLPALNAIYVSGIVGQMVEQLRSQYPAGQYQRFNVEALPWLGSYVERLAAARNMAGLFVLIGLGLTMIRLNGVVERIGEASSADMMTNDAFLAAMGLIMRDIGGAFLASIWGLVLMVAALAVVGFVDRTMQRRVQEVEHAASMEVIPRLTRLHERSLPNLTLSDLLEDTGSNLRSLNQAVGGLTTGLSNTLSGLGDQIENMLENFRSFQQQYVMLNDLLKHLDEASKNLKDTTRSIDGAARRLINPVDDFNATLLKHLETVADSVEVSREGYRSTSDQLTTLHAHIDELLMEIRNGTSVHYQESAARQTEMQEQIEGYIKYLMTQGEQVERQMKATASALHGSSGPQLMSAIQGLDRTVQRLEMATRQFDGAVPLTLFAWSAGMAKKGRHWMMNGRGTRARV